MRTSYKDFKSGKDFSSHGGSKPRGFAGGKGFGHKGFGPPQLFKARCAQCGAPCEVPFKPNGKKPVLCSLCFKKDEGGAGGFKKPWEQRPARLDSRDRQDRPRFNPTAGSGMGMDAAQFKTLNTKLDRIIDALEDAGIIEDEG